MAADHLPEVSSGRVALAATVLALGLAACGSTASSSSGTGTAKTQNIISGTAAAGTSAFSTSRYALAVPSDLTHETTTGATGRQVTAWTGTGSSDVSVEATYDPHPATLQRAVSAATAGARSGYDVSQLSVTDVLLSGARSARLIVDSGKSTGPTATPQSDAELIALTRSGAILDVLVVSHSSSSSTPLSVIDSVKLSG